MRAALRGRDAEATSFPLVSSDRGDRGRALRRRRSRRYEKPRSDLYPRREINTMVLPLTPEDGSSLECMGGSPPRPWIKFACSLRRGYDTSLIDERLVNVYAQNAAGRVVKRCLGECLALVDVLGDEESQRD